MRMRLMRMPLSCFVENYLFSCFVENYLFGNSSKQKQVTTIRILPSRALVFKMISLPNKSSPEPELGSGSWLKNLFFGILKKKGVKDFGSDPSFASACG